MFITFQSKAYENISYLASVANQLLSMLGHSGTVPGAIKAEDLPNALRFFKKNLAQSDISRNENHQNDKEPEISLPHRAVPLIHLIEASIKQGCDIQWSYTKGIGL